MLKHHMVSYNDVVWSYTPKPEILSVFWCLNEKRNLDTEFYELNEHPSDS